MIRIIGGRAKGTLLAAPKGMDTRPTLGRTRESIFNVLANVGLLETKVLDIFAGTGALGLEAVSRGAAEAVLIDRATGRILKENARRCGAERQVHILTTEAERALRTLAGERFDYIFLDPPYRRGYVNTILQTVVSLRLPADGAIIIAEHVSAEGPDLSLLGETVSLWKEKTVGETAVTYLLCKER